MASIKLRNEKLLADAIREFRTYKEPSEKKFDRYDYFKIEEYVELLDECFGVDGYAVSYSDAESVTVSPTQVVLLVKATVSVYGEDGSVVYTFEGYGTHEPTREAQKDEKNKPVPGTISDRAINLETLGQVGCVNALKSACTQLGCFGMRTLDSGRRKSAAGRSATPRPSGSYVAPRANNGAPAPAAARPSAAPAQTEQAPDVEKSFYVCEPAKDGGKDRNGNQVFILSCHEIVDGRPVEKASEIIFYNNFYKDASRLARITTGWDGIPSRFRFKVREIAREQRKNKDAYSSYTFRGFTA
ncbi:MAG: hypothetical protein IKO41_00140 [Lachnospiraceae bacterium]|nr:hypothetical protein [Lachnospiraceae bacterium]